MADISTTVIVKQPQPMAVVKVNEPQPVAIATQLLRGAKGATDITAISPLELNGSDELSLKSYIFTQSTNLATWVIEHNLNQFYPAITIKDNNNDTLIGQVIADDANTLRIIFNQPQTGVAYLNG